MSQSICPYLGTLDKADNAAPPVDYPSFENQCFAIIADEPLLLAEQAAVCLASGHRACPRFRMAQQIASDEGEPSTAASPGRLSQATLADEMAHQFPLPDWAEAAGVAKEGSLFGRRSWAWAGAAIIFMIMVLCGGIFAAYTGWQMASANYLAGRTGSVSTVSNPNTPGQAQTFVVITATSEAANQPAQAPVATASLVVVPPTLTPVGVFPLAVTPTPVVINPAITNLQPSTDSIANNPAGNPAQAITATQPIAQIGTPPDVTLPTPAIDLDVEIPTRRPTPIYDVPTSTPVPLEPTATTTPTPTPTLLLGTPVVQFAPLLYTLESGKCTLLRWHAENVREVYFENTGVPGIGEREVCVDDEDEVFRLAVILGDGSTKIYTATITYLPPTPTQTPTASFTPERNTEPTPTWTPDIPTATPTPPTILGTGLEVFGENYRVCAAGSDCEFDFLVTNSGNTPDTLLVTIVQSGPWQALICADGGDCSTANLTLNDVNPGGTKLVKLKVSIASDATPQTASYALQSFSASSGGGVSSGVAAVEVEVQ